MKITNNKVVYPKVAVLLSTYNGEKYLRVQIDTILKQKNIQVLLFIRDDGSKDNTLSIINEYIQFNSNIKLVDQKDIQNIGIKKSYFALLEYVYQNFPDIEYYSFADQDDAWLKEKLITAINKISRSTNTRGCLYYSNKTFVDSNLNLIKEEHIKYYGDLYEAFWQSLASGCTMVFNKKLVKYILLDMPRIDCLHDAWVYRSAKVLSSDIIFDENSYILYRQHDNNVCGIDSTILPTYNLKSISSFVSGFFKENNHFISNFFTEEDRIYHNYINKTNKKYINSLKTYRYNIIAKNRLIFNNMSYKRGPKIFIVWSMKIIFNRI